MLAVLGILFTTACGNPSLKDGKEVIAEINGKKYTADELYEELKGQYGYNVVINWVDAQIAEKEIETTDELTKEAEQYVQLYTSYAESYGMPIGEFASTQMGLTGIKDEEGLKAFFITQAKLSATIKKYVIEKLTDKEVEDYYNENYKTVYTYRDILVKKDDDADDTVNEIKKKLKDKSGDKLVDEFTELAKKYSEADNASDGGLVERAIKTDADEAVWKKLGDLKDGKATTDKVEGSDGYHFILRVSKDDPDELDDVKDEIKDAVATEKLTNDQMLSYDIITELRNKYKLAFYDTDLKDSYNNFLDELEEYRKQQNESSSDSDSESDSE